MSGEGFQEVDHLGSARRALQFRFKCEAGRVVPSFVLQVELGGGPGEGADPPPTREAPPPQLRTLPRTVTGVRVA